MGANARMITGTLAGVMTLALMGIIAAPEALASWGSDEVIAAAPANGLQAPAGPAINQIDTNSKAAVRAAYLDRYEANMVRPEMSEGVDLNNCEAGRPLAAGVAPTIEAWNFLRGLNGLDAVSVDENSPISKYAQAAAMVSAKNGKLSHYPAQDGFKCATEEAVLGARHSNLAQSVSQTAAETALWYYMDYSADENPVNDQLGHRLFMMDPKLSKTAMGAVEGYTALSVRTGEDYPGVPEQAMRNENAPTPEVMSWPSAGFFPKQLLTSVGQTKSGEDVERWSFSVLGADLSAASATVIDPAGHEVPVEIVRPHDENLTYTPRDIAGYSTLLIKLPTIKDLPQGQDNRVYQVKVSGVQGAAQSEYEYEVILFDPTTPLQASAPAVDLVASPLSGVGYAMTDPIEMQVSAWPAATLQWQERTQGGAWKDIAGANSASYLPEGMWTVERGQNTEYRLVATNSEGTTTSDPVRVGVQGVQSMPTSQTVAAGQTATFTSEALVDADGQLYDTKINWEMLENGKWVNIPENGHFTGTTTSNLQVHNVSAADSGLTVRMVIRSKVFKLAGYNAIVVWTDGKAALNVAN